MKTLSRDYKGNIMLFAILALFTLVLIPSTALAHDVTPGDAGYIQECLASAPMGQFRVI
ncbi:hypothetical protein SAMN05443432_11195 [Roseovarius litoreus]|uniref:Uncharacterized protein n=1 Tax=Roseovarius litoreus TaxID=1155722 RepID=A0A1M7KNU4_9RHOB|nr:hypothetical protein SAMN05443432_11195 [Roseovarius litoreus]